MIEVAEYLRKMGIQPTVQRVAIAEYLMEQRTHPSADEVYVELHPFMRTLSKATVYNTLNLFHRKNIVNIVVTDDGDRHFDSTTTPHAHIVCPICRKVMDISLDENEYKALEKVAQRAESEWFTLVMRKCCQDCKDSNEESTQTSQI